MLTKFEILKKMETGTYFQYPSQWVYDALGETLNEEQEKIFNTAFTGNKQGTAITGGAGTGKTYLASRAALYYFYNYGPSKIIVNAAIKSARDIFWQYLIEANKKIVLNEHVSIAQRRIFIKECDWYILEYISHAPHYLMGFMGENVLFIIENANHIANSYEFFANLEYIWGMDNYRLWVSDYGAIVTDKTFFTDIFYIKKLRHRFNTFHLSPEMSCLSNVRKKQLKDYLGEDQYKIRILGQFVTPHST